MHFSSHFQSSSPFEDTISFSELKIMASELKYVKVSAAGWLFVTYKITLMLFIGMFNHRNYGNCSLLKYAN